MSLLPTSPRRGTHRAPPGLAFGMHVGDLVDMQANSTKLGPLGCFARVMGALKRWRKPVCGSLAMSARYEAERLLASIYLSICACFLWLFLVS